LVVIAAGPQGAGGWRLAVGTAPDQGSRAEESLCHYVIDSNEPLLIDDARRDQPIIAGVPPGHAGVIAWAAFPIRDPSGCAIGALSVTGRLPRVWTAHDIEVLTMLAEVASREAALQAIEEHGAERAELARTLQESLLPPRLPDVPGLQVAASYAAGGTGAEVLGDFYDVFPSVRGSWGLVVGDVCGKGAPAAKGTALARYTLRAQAHRGSRPSVILGGLNQALLDWDTDDRRFLTAIYVTVRPILAGALVQVSAAGHPLALLRRSDSTVRTLGRPGTLLGLVAEPDLHDTRRLLRPGDSLVLYTDGVTEARSHLLDRELYGESRLEELVASLGGLPAARMADAILKSARSFSGGNLSDDTVVLVLKVP
jgi:phosphoserine phosphatase RsbU/P